MYNYNKDYFLHFEHNFIVFIVLIVCLLKGKEKRNKRRPKK